MLKDHATAACLLLGLLAAYKLQVRPLLSTYK